MEALYTLGYLEEVFIIEVQSLMTYKTNSKNKIKKDDDILKKCELKLKHV